MPTNRAYRHGDRDRSIGRPQALVAYLYQEDALLILHPAYRNKTGGRPGRTVELRPDNLFGARVTVTMEIEAEIPSGAPDHVARTVTENSRTLKFTSQGFEVE